MPMLTIVSLMCSAGEIKQYTISIVVSYKKTINARCRITTPKTDAIDRGTKITKQNVFYIYKAFEKPRTKHIIKAFFIFSVCLLNLVYYSASKTPASLQI